MFCSAVWGCEREIEKERKLVVDSVYHSKIMDSHESNQAAFPLAVLFMFSAGICLPLP